MLSIIVAISDNNCIGNNNELPWRLPEDLRYFKNTTMNSPVVMGRKTFESIGRPLPGRDNYVLTRDKTFSSENVTVLSSLDECKDISGDEVFIIGGAHIYEQMINVVDRLYITHIHETFEGDSFFPEINESIWEKTSSVKGIKNDKNPYDYEFVVYDRK